MGRTSVVSLLLLIAVASFGLAQQPRLLPPVLRVTLPTADDLVVAGNRVIFRRDGRLVAFDTAAGRERWRSSAPGPFAAAGQRVFTLKADGTLTALGAASGRSEWSARTLPEGRALYVAGDVVVVSSPARSEAFDQTTGKRLWVRDDAMPPAEAVVAGRFWLWRSGGGDSHSAVRSSFLIDLATGKDTYFPGSGNYIDSQATITHPTRDGKEFVEVRQNPSPGLIDVSPEKYEVEVSFFDARAWLADPSASRLTQRLGKLMAGPRPGCRPDNDPRAGLVLPYFVAADDRQVWLSGYDSCGGFMARVLRAQPQNIAYFETPLDAAQRQAVYGESALLASVRAGGARWSAQLTGKVYALRDDLHLEVLDAQTGRRTASYQLPPDQAKGVIVGSENQKPLIFRSPASTGFVFAVFQLP